MSRYRIPSTAEAMLTDLSAAAELAHATDWKKAALVAALVGPARGQGSRSDLVNTDQVTVPALAAMKFRGLRSAITIRYYRDNWTRHFPVPQPGERIDFAAIEIEWPGVPEEELAQQTGMSAQRKATLLDAGKAAGMPTGAKVVDIAANPKAMAEAIKADPATARAAAAALEEVEDPGAAASIGREAARIRESDDLHNRGEGAAERAYAIIAVQAEFLRRYEHWDHLGRVQAMVAEMVTTHQEASDLTPEMFQ